VGDNGQGTAGRGFYCNVCLHAEPSSVKKPAHAAQPER
jgi:hypothetical protein